MKLHLTLIGVCFALVVPASASAAFVHDVAGNKIQPYSRWSTSKVPAPDADVTVILYVNHNVKANHPFKKGELDDKAIEKILADVKLILPEKK